MFSFTPLLRRRPFHMKHHHVKPSAVAQFRLDADTQWCGICHQIVDKQAVAQHNSGKSHQVAVMKLNKLKNLSLAMWEEHRGARLDQESGKDKDLEAEFKSFRASQQQRELQFRR